MSYNTIWQCAHDQAFQSRVEACAAQEGVAEPNAVMYKIIYPISVHADIEQAYAYALETGNPNPGGDETVITDQMILGAVQAALPSMNMGTPPPPAT